MRMLRGEYLDERGPRMAEMQRLIEACASGTTAAVGELHRLMHQLTGSAGSYGFAEISVIARQMEQRLKPLPAPDAALADELRAGAARIVALFDEAQP